MSDSTSDRQSGGAPELDIELDVSPPAKSAPATKPAAPPAKPDNAPKSPLDYFGKGFDEEHFGVSSAAPSEANAATAFSGGAIDFDEGAGAGGDALELQSYRPPAAAGSPAPAPAASSAAPPSAPVRSAPAASPLLEPANNAAASLLADYGPAPKAIHLTPLYAYRVFMRQRELRAALARVNTETQRAETGVDELLANLARAERDRLEGDTRFETALGSVRQLEQIQSERGAVLSQTTQSQEVERAEFARQIADLEAQIEARRGIESTAAQQVARAEEIDSRTQAKQKRILIEARSVAQVAQAAAGGPNLPIAPEHASKIQELKTEAAAMQPEVDARQQELVAAQTELANVRREIAAFNAHIRNIRDRERAAARRFQTEVSKQNEGVLSAERELRTALAAVGRALVESREAKQADPTQLEAITAAEREVARLSQSRDLHLAALDACDREAVKRGYVLVIAAALVVLLLFVALMVFH